MNPRAVILTAIAAVTLAAGYASYQFARPAACTHCSEDTNPGFAWLQREFSPAPGQLARIRELHAAHQVACAAHCEEIARLRAELADLQKGGARTDVLAAKQHELASADARCRASITYHVRAVADLLGPEAGPRYLSIVLPRLEHFDHQGPPDVELSPPHGTASP